MDVKLVHAPVSELMYDVVSPTRVNVGVFVCMCSACGGLALLMRASFKSGRVSCS